MNREAGPCANFSCLFVVSRRAHSPYMLDVYACLLCFCRLSWGWRRSRKETSRRRWETPSEYPKGYASLLKAPPTHIPCMHRWNTSAFFVECRWHPIGRSDIPNRKSDGLLTDVQAQCRRDRGREELGYFWHRVFVFQTPCTRKLHAIPKLKRPKHRKTLPQQ